MDLRLQGQMGGEGLNAWHWSKLFYLSLHTVDCEQNYNYGSSRVLRECMDAWLDKKFTFGGLGYNDENAGLTDQVPFCMHASRQASHCVCVCGMCVSKQAGRNCRQSPGQRS